MNHSIKQIKMVTLVTLLAGLSMGNESCQKASGRVLKMDVELGRVAAQPVVMPTGERIDFGYVANALFYQQVMANTHFVISNPIPTPTSTLAVATTTSLTGKLTQKLVSSIGFSKLTNDQKLMEDYGFADAVRMRSSVNSAANKSLMAKTEAADDEMPACLYNLPQAKLAGEVVSFEANFGAGLSLGYGANGAIPSPAGVGGTLNFTSARLQMGLRAVDPMNDLLIASAKGVSTQSNVKFGLSIVSALLGFDFFFKTPIATVVSSGFDKALAAMVTDYSAANSSTGSWGDAWESRVVYDKEVTNGDTQIMIRGGTRYGLQRGDTFTVTNMHYSWTGAPCESPLRYRVPMTATPVANIEIIAVGDNVSVARVSQYLMDERIKPGAQVKLLKMYVAPTK